MAPRWKRLVLVALLAGACGRGARQASGPAAPTGDDWMDGATVRVALDVAAGRETVTLVDPATGFEQLMDDEALIEANERDAEEGDEG